MIFSLFLKPPSPDPAVFENEALPHLDSVYRVARRLTGREKEAEDLVQETYLRAFRFFHQFVPGTNCRAWLMRILHNVHVNTFHRRSREPSTVPLDGGDDPFAWSPIDRIADASDPGPEEACMAQAWDKEILAALDHLPEEYRGVVILCDVEDLTYKEIAEVLKVPIGTVRSRLNRGRRQLQKLLADYARERNLFPHTEPSAPRPDGNGVKSVRDTAP